MSTLEPTAALPPLYARWVDELLASPIPAETRATCEDCAMCDPAGEHPDGSASYFSPQVKCCSYLPRLANFLVGRALEERDLAFSAGRATLESRIDEGVGVTPLGLGQSARIGLIYRNSPSAFGRARALRCPHYLDEGGGRCGVWRNRNAVCATWFCKHERGAIGLAFWFRLRDLLSAVEKSLAIWCVLESDLDAAALDRLYRASDAADRPGSLTADDLDERAPADAQWVWGGWYGREREFYRECARRVDELSWSDVVRIGGAGVELLARVTRESFAALRAEQLPERLVPGKLQILSTGREGVRVVSYVGSDPLDLDPDVMEILPHFDGRRTSDVLASLESEEGIVVEDDLLRRLADFEILVSPERNPG